MKQHLSFKLKVTLTLTVAILLTITCFFTIRESTRIPGTVAIRGPVSKPEAESLYRTSNKVLSGNYRRRIWSNLTAGRFKMLLQEIRRGPERIYLLSKQDDGTLVAKATNRVGFECTICLPTQHITGTGSPPAGIVIPLTKNQQGQKGIRFTTGQDGSVTCILTNRLGKPYTVKLPSGRGVPGGLQSTNRGIMLIQPDIP
jgi:hypothetical protein